MLKLLRPIQILSFRENWRYGHITYDRFRL